MNTKKAVRSASLNLVQLEARVTPTLSLMGPHSTTELSRFEGTGLTAFSLRTELPPVPAGAQHIIQPDRFVPFSLDSEVFRSVLPGGTNTFRPDDPSRVAVVAIPAPNGTFQRFEVWGIDVVTEELSNRYGGQIRTFRGQGIDDPHAILVADMTLQGFRAQVQTPKGWWYVDPAFHGSQEVYQSYARDDLSKNPHEGGCRCQLCQDAMAGEVAERVAARGGVGGSPGFSLETASEFSYGGFLRTYRTAITTDGKYYQFHSGATVNTPADKAIVLSAITTAMNRVSGIFEQEMAVRFQLVPNTDLLIYANNDSPYSGSGGALLNAIQSKIDAVIGQNNYELGHLFSGNGSLAGLAGLGVIARNGSEARGYTGLSSPVGDPFTVDYVSHEIGHQANAEHNWNSRNLGGAGMLSHPAYSVGSGSTIMDYAGLGGSDDYQTKADAMFSWESLQTMSIYLSRQHDGGFTVTPIPNQTPPRITGGGNYVIPARSLFELTAAASDAEGDLLTYSWEQADRGVSQFLNEPDNGSSPILRPFAPSTNPVRTFPTLSKVNSATINWDGVTGTLFLDGTAKTGNSNGYSKGERLPITTRDLNFRVVVRDNNVNGGGFANDSVRLSVHNTGSAFAITNPSSSFAAGSSQTINWNVAGTTASPIFTDSVRIRLSIDGGFTFPYVLADRTPNDGSEVVTIPHNISSTSNNARIRVDALNSVYFALSNKMTITASAAVGGTVTGKAYYDANGNGVNNSEPALTNRLVFADANGNGRFDNGLPLVSVTGNYPLTLNDQAINRVPFVITGGASKVADARVKLNLSHANPSELDAFLISPSGRRIELFTNLGNSGANLTDVVFSMAAANGINQAVAPYTGTFQPEGDLRNLAGESVAGTWQLEITDRVAGNVATLNSWTLSLVREYSSTAAPITTTSNAPIFMPLTVSDSYPVQDVDVRVNVLSTFADEVNIFVHNPTSPITSPFTGSIQLNEGGTGGWANNGPVTSFTNTIFDDQAAQSIYAGTAPLSGRFRPHSPLTPYYTGTINGTWNLRAARRYSNFNPTIQNWSVMLTGDFPATAAAQTIPDNGTLNAVLPMTLAGSPVQDVEVKLNISHADVSQLKAYLLSPAGTKVQLVGGQTGANFTNTGFDDEASTQITAGSAPYSATFRPLEPLSRFDGENAASNWTLRIDDTVSGVTGTLNGWSLAIVAPTSVNSIRVPLTISKTTQTSQLLIDGASGFLTDLDVTVNLTHNNLSEVSAYLLGPNNAKVNLALNLPGSGFVSTTFDDEANTLITAGSSPYTGRFRPVGSLSVFDGLSPNGFWTLQLDDNNTSANVGVLTSWSIAYSTGERYTTTDSSGAYSLSIPAGAFDIREELPGNFVRTQPASGHYAVSVSSGTPTFANSDFGSMIPLNASLQINNGNPQRSVVSSLTVTIVGTNLTLNSGAFVLDRTGVGGTTGPVTLSVNSATVVNGNTVVTLNLPVVYSANGSLIDGTYTLNVNGANIQSGTFPLVGSSAFNFHRLFGDGNGDKTVNSADFALIRSAIGTRFGQSAFSSIWDFDNDGDVDNADVQAMRDRNGVVLP